MVRRYAELVDVRGASQADGLQAPTAFVWRDRLYVVREVVGHWRERRAWWSGAAAQALHGDGQADRNGHPDGNGHSAGHRDGDGRGDGAVAPPVDELGSEQELWRVEASRGHSYATGVYDLCQDVSATGTTGTPGAWRLLRVAD
jgi:hypothetical protein